MSSASASREQPTEKTSGVCSEPRRLLSPGTRKVYVQRLGDRALVEQANLVTEHDGFLHVVRYENGAESEVDPKVFYQTLHLETGQSVERAKGFVQ